MKSNIYLKPTPYTRQLKPKSSFPKKTLPVQNLSFSNDQEGKTLIKIYPSQVSVTSQELIDMIKEKKESIQKENSTCILRENILVAIHNFACDEDTSTYMDQDSTLPALTQPTEPRRPINAFILYRTALRKRIKALFPSFNNSDISKFTGAMWKAADKSVKEKYIKQAMERRVLHKQMYPDFEYNTKKENVEKMVSNCEEYSFINDNWDDYFNWCIQNATTGIVTEGARGGGELNSLPAFTNWSSLNTGVEDEPFNLTNLLGVGFQESNGWKEVCDMVNQFFPEDSNQNTLIDDRLWLSIGGTELKNLEDNNLSQSDFN